MLADVLRLSVFLLQNSGFHKEAEGKLITVLDNIKLRKVENKLDDKIKSQRDMS